MCFMTFFNSDKPVLFPDISYSFYSVWADVHKVKYETVALDENFNIIPETFYKENGGIISLILMHLRLYIWNSIKLKI